MPARSRASWPKRIASKLRADGLVAKAEVAGPGFIDLTLKPSAWIAGPCARSSRREIAMVAARRGGAAPSMSNTSPPIRPDRCMSAIAVAPCSVTRLPICWLSAATMSRKYYVNDAGAQVDASARSAFLRYREALGGSGRYPPEGLYPGDYLQAGGGGTCGPLRADAERTSRSEMAPDRPRSAPSR